MDEHASIRKALEPFHPHRAILFGSLARRRFDEFSDVDLIVVLESRETFEERGARVARAVGEAVNRAVDALVYTPEEFARLSSRQFGIVPYAIETGIELI